MQQAVAPCRDLASTSDRAGGLIHQHREGSCIIGRHPRQAARAIGQAQHHRTVGHAAILGEDHGEGFDLGRTAVAFDDCRRRSAPCIGLTLQVERRQDRVVIGGTRGHRNRVMRGDEATLAV